MGTFELSIQILFLTIGKCLTSTISSMRCHQLPLLYLYGLVGVPFTMPFGIPLLLSIYCMAQTTYGGKNFGGMVSKILPDWKLRRKPR